MRVFIVYAHPSEDSFTRVVRDEFIECLKKNGHSYVISDLYKMGFKTDISESEYLREPHYRDDLPLEKDIVEEQRKINECDILVFVYPLFWTEAPAKLVGWFDRVWTNGFAYGNMKMKQLDKAICLCIAGRSEEHLREHGHLESIKNIMLGDRIFDRAKEKELIVLGGTTRSDMELRNKNWEIHLKTVRKIADEL